MDNGQMPQVQPLTGQPQVVGPSPQAIPQPAPVMGKKNSDLIKIIAIVVLSLLSLTFIGLFLWMSVQFNEVSTDVQEKIDFAVAAAKDEQALKDEAEFAEREKDPFKSFSGPADYGELSFKYPKTWSVYIASSAEKGGDFSAYFNPNQVEAVGKDTINALRVTIRDKSFEDVVAEYQRFIDRADSGLTVQNIVFGDRDKAEVSGNLYIGKIPNTDLNGYILVFKIRDKTAIIQTDSVLFENDFNEIINTITFNA